VCIILAGDVAIINNLIISDANKYKDESIFRGLGFRGGGLNPACRFQIIFFSSSPLSDLADAVLTNYGIGLQGQSGGRGAPTFWKKLGMEPDGISDCPDKFYNIFKMILCMG